MTIRSIGGTLACALFILFLAGCSTAIDLTRLKVPTTSAAVCKDVNQLISDQNAPGGETPPFRFSIPVASPTSGGAPGGAALTQVATFREYTEAVNAAKVHLPSAIRDHSVTDAIVAIITKASAQGQLNRAKASGQNVTSQQAELNKFQVPSSISNKDLTDFANKLFDGQLAPNFVAPQSAPSGAPTKSQLFSTYFDAYYQGKFYDRLGVNITKPTTSLQIPDSEIAAALTVLLEYTADLVDPTPVLGNKDLDANGQPVPDTTYYPGKNANEPTALVAHVARYQNIAKNKCGVTEETAPLLANLANSAADRAAAVSGLASGSWGGFEVGLGFLGKFSVGDNQTLTTIVKTTASRVALRASLAASYWALDSIGQRVGRAAPSGAAPALINAESYLKFSDSE